MAPKRGNSSWSATCRRTLWGWISSTPPEYWWDTANALLGETHPHRLAWVRAYLEPLLAGQTDAVLTASEAEAVENGILLKPVSVMDREDARWELRALLDHVHAKLPKSDKTPRKQEEEITRIIKERRREDAAPCRT